MRAEVRPSISFRSSYKTLSKNQSIKKASGEALRSVLQVNRKDSPRCTDQATVENQKAGRRMFGLTEACISRGLTFI